MAQKPYQMQGLPCEKMSQQFLEDKGDIACGMGHSILLCRECTVQLRLDGDGEGNHPRDPVARVHREPMMHRRWSPDAGAQAHKEDIYGMYLICLYYMSPYLVFWRTAGTLRMAACTTRFDDSMQEMYSVVIGNCRLLMMGGSSRITSSCSWHW